MIHFYVYGILFPKGRIGRSRPAGLARNPPSHVIGGNPGFPRTPFLEEWGLSLAHALRAQWRNISIEESMIYACVNV